jgi:ApbE superfamily uncharacterized protein (UPF0280 family)
MNKYHERIYRKRVKAEDIVFFQVGVKQTDLWVGAEINLESETRDAVMNYRRQLEDYIRRHPAFLTTLQPVALDPYAPPIAAKMIQETQALGVGPMASVAGAIAQFVAVDLLRWTDQVIVENGGDIFIKVNRPAKVSIFAGTSPFSEKIGLKIEPESTPVGICTSSGTIGHSLSHGKADAVCIVSPSAVLADGAATALCNRIRDSRDLEKISQWAKEIEGLSGGVAILKDHMASWGKIEIISL